MNRKSINRPTNQQSKHNPSARSKQNPSASCKSLCTHQLYVLNNCLGFTDDNDISSYPEWV